MRSKLFYVYALAAMFASPTLQASVDENFSKSILNAGKIEYCVCVASPCPCAELKAIASSHIDIENDEQKDPLFETEIAGLSCEADFDTDKGTGSISCEWAQADEQKDPLFETEIAGLSCEADFDTDKGTGSISCEWAQADEQKDPLFETEIAGLSCGDDFDADKGTGSISCEWTQI